MKYKKANGVLVGLFVVGLLLFASCDTTNAAENRSASRWADSVLPDSADIHERITARYQNPRLTQFVRTHSSNQAVSLYLEISQLIDARHLSPASYQERTRKAVDNLIHAVENETFLNANAIDSSPNRVRAFQQTLMQIRAAENVRNSSDALNAMQWTMQYAHRQIGLSPTVVATEFVFGATDSLDRYSTFIPPERNAGPSAMLEEQVVGIGVSIEAHGRGVKIVKVIPKGPAAAAKLAKGDIIVAVNGQSLEDKSLDQITDLITGRAGTALTIDVKRSEQSPFRVRLVRQVVEINSVSDVSIIDGSSKIGYFKLERFASTSSKEIDDALWSLYRKGMKSLVIDLRGNPGGLLTAAIEIADKFVPCGTLVSTRGRHSQDNSQSVAKYSRTWKIPLVVLVDEDSASASEILAAAIQENERGVIVGRRSFGKGTVQTQFPLRSISASVRLTTAKFYSPNGREMAGAGVSPDELVETESSDQFDADIDRAIDVVRSDLPGSLATAHIDCRIRPGALSSLDS